MAEKILECESQKEGSDYILTISAIPTLYYNKVLDLIEECSCRLLFFGASIVQAQGSYGEILQLEQEVLAIVARIAHLENCLSKSFS